MVQPFRDAVPPLRFVHYRGGYGGTGVSGSDYVAVVLEFEVIATRRVDALRVTDLEVFNPAGTVGAHGVAPMELRVSLPGLDENHNPNSAPFYGTIAEGTTLRLRVSASVTPLPNASRVPLRYRLTFATAEGDRGLVVEGPLDSPSATAGPAHQ